MKKGFTLIEILVAVAVFSIVLVSFINLFSSAFSYQREAINSAYLVNSVSYATEYMARSLRMAQRQTNELPEMCLSMDEGGEIYSIIKQGEGVSFIDHEGNCRSFYKDGDNLKTTMEKNGEKYDALPSNIKVEKLNFVINGDSSVTKAVLGQERQPLLSFSLKARVKDSSEEIEISSAVSQRQLNLE